MISTTGRRNVSSTTARRHGRRRGLYVTTLSPACLRCWSRRSRFRAAESPSDRPAVADRTSGRRLHGTRPFLARLRRWPGHPQFRPAVVDRTSDRRSQLRPRQMLDQMLHARPHHFQQRRGHTPNSSTISASTASTTNSRRPTSSSAPTPSFATGPYTTPLVHPQRVRRPQHQGRGRQHRDPRPRLEARQDHHELPHEPRRPRQPRVRQREQHHERRERRHPMRHAPVVPNHPAVQAVVHHPPRTGTAPRR